MEKTDVVVSVVCNTFNQKNYIRNALDGFLMQKTSFPIEILVHDDASTDGTAEIVREYADKHPDLIFPILQEENQWSKSVAITETFQISRAKGKYIALCEGDDYWTDPLKLQKQVEAMERHPEIDMCAHRMGISKDEKIVGSEPSVVKNAIFTPQEVIAGGGGFVMTASLLCRKSLYDNQYQFMNLMSCDYVWQMGGALRGGMLYLKDCMGVYRKQAVGSWSASVEKDIEKHIAWWKRIQTVLYALNEETNCQYADAVNEQIAMMDLNVYVKKGKWRNLFSKEGRELLKFLPLKKQVFVVLLAIRRDIINFLAVEKRGSSRDR